MTASKIDTAEDLQTHVRRRRQAGQRIAMTNGCFDLLHPGHVASLQEARTAGRLPGRRNSDGGTRELKGPGHPIIDQQGRAEMLAALECVDYVVIFDDPSVAGLVERVLPDVLVKAAQDWPEEVVGHEIVAKHGGRVVLTPMVPQYSTSAIIQKLRSLPE